MNINLSYYHFNIYSAHRRQWKQMHHREWKNKIIEIDTSYESLFPQDMIKDIYIFI